MRKRFVDVAYAFFFQHLWLLTGLCLITTLTGVLWACIHNGHLPPEFPSPSDTGVFQPEGAYFTFGMFWAMIGLAATIGRHSLVFGTFLDDQRKLYRAASSTHQHIYGGIPKAGKAAQGCLGALTAMLLSERDDVKLLKMGTIIGVAGACFGTMVAAFDVRKHVVLHTIGAACLFIFTNLYYSILLRINHLILEKWAVIRETRRREDETRHSTSSGSTLHSTHDNLVDLAPSPSSSSPPLTSSSSSVLLSTSPASSVLLSSSSSSSLLPSKEAKPGVGNSSSLNDGSNGGGGGFKAAAVRSPGKQAISNLTWLRVGSVMMCWFCLFGIIGFRLQFVREGGHQSRDKERVGFLIFWANLFEWIWLGLVLLYGFIVFYWDYYHSPVSSPYFGFSASASNRANPLVFRIRCEVQRPDDVHIV